MTTHSPAHPGPPETSAAQARPPAAVPSVTGADAAVVFGAFVGSLLVGALAAVLGLRAFGVGGPAAFVSVLVAGSAAVAAAVGLAVRSRAGLSAAALGLVRPRRSLWHLVWQVPASVVASVLVAAAAGTALGVVPDGAGGDPELAGPGVPLALAALGAAAAVVVMPLVEEVVFRRYVLDWLRGRLGGRSAGTALAVCVTTAAFAVLHVAPPVMLYLAPLALCMALLRIWHASLWPPLVLHAVNNALATAIAVSAAG